MKTATPKQISFIKSLVAQTGAYQDGEGMMVNMTVYPDLIWNPLYKGRLPPCMHQKLLRL